MIDYLMVIALFLLLVVLSLPTMVQLAELLRADHAKPHRALQLKAQAPHADRAVAETQLAH